MLFGMVLAKSWSDKEWARMKMLGNNHEGSVPFTQSDGLRVGLWRLSRLNWRWRCWPMRQVTTLRNQHT